MPAKLLCECHSLCRLEAVISDEHIQRRYFSDDEMYVEIILDDCPHGTVPGSTEIAKGSNYKLYKYSQAYIDMITAEMENIH